MTNRTRTRSAARRSLVVALVGLLTLAFGVVAPSPRATAAFGQPTGVDAKALGGSNGLSVTWKAPADGTPAAYKVSWGTSSSYVKATGRRYVAGTAATLSGLSTSTYYYVWVEPWSATSSSGTSAGAVSKSDRVKTSSFDYYAPVEIHAVNPTKTSMEVTWRTVTGSPGYVLRATAPGQPTKYQYGFDGSGVFTGLKPGVSYTFTAANRLPVAGNTDLPGLLMSKWSTAKSTKATNPATVALPDGTTTDMADQPTGLTVTETDHQSIGLSWTPPAGYDPAKHRFRVYWAEDQEMTDNDAYTNLVGTSGTLTGMSANTNYYVRIRMVQNFSDPVTGVVTTVAVSDRTEAVMAKTRSPKGYLSGTVTGVTGAVLSDYVAVAYSKSTGEVNAQGPVSSTGRYRLEVRPGAYYIQLAYVGSGSYTTQWVDSTGEAAYTREDSTSVTAVLGSTPVTAPPVAVGAGATLAGRVVGPTGVALRDVYVSARTAWSQLREVVAQTATASDGRFTLRGLPPNRTVYVRANGSAVGYRADSVSTPVDTPSAGATRTVKDVQLLPL